jgi:hypothetical protein
MSETILKYQPHLNGMAAYNSWTRIDDDNVPGGSTGAPRNAYFAQMVHVVGTAPGSSGSSSDAIPNGDFFQVTVDDSATSIDEANLPDTSAYVMITVEGGDGRVRFDDTDPTASVGHPVYSGTTLTWRRAMALTATFIRAGDSDMILSCSPMN